MLNRDLSSERAEKAAALIDKASDFNELEEKVFAENVLGLDEEEMDSIYNKLFFYLYMGGCYAAAKPKAKQQELSFPGRVIEKNGVRYCIHGIRHAQDMKNIIQDEFGDMENVVCEPNLARKYGLTRAIAQTRTDECKYLSFKEYYSGVLSPIFRKLHYYIKDKFSKKEALMEEAKDFREIFDLNGRKINIEDAYLPERHEQGYIFSHLDSKIYKTSLLRSLSSSELLETMTSELSLQEIHGIYGLGHEAHIAYFLQHEDIAQEFKDRFRKEPFDRLPQNSISMIMPLLAIGGTAWAAGSFASNPHDAWGAFNALAAYILAKKSYSIISGVHGWRLKNKAYKNRKKD